MFIRVIYMCVYSEYSIVRRTRNAFNVMLYKKFIFGWLTDSRQITSYRARSFLPFRRAMAPPPANSSAR